MRRLRTLCYALPLLFACAGAAAACSSSDGTDASGAADGDSGATGVEATTPYDGGGDPDLDGGTKDGGKDAKSTDGGAGADGDILGTLASGACGIVKNQLAATAPTIENNLLVFMAGELFDKPSLSAGGQTLFDTPNAGGSSGESEVMSFEVLRYCEGATLVKTETEITYEPPDASGGNAITDILVAIDAKKVGVSVTRAYRPANQPAMTDLEIKALLEKKLKGIVASSARVLPADKWVKQILHVFSSSQANSDAIARVWPTIEGAVRADTITLVTQTQGGGFVYCKPLPPLGTDCP